LQRAIDCEPDLAMIDISMPDMTGWDLVSKLRGLPTLQALKIIMVSANAHEFTVGGEGQPHDAFIIKPIDLQALLERIGTLLRLKWVYEMPGANADESGDGSATLPAHARHHLDDLYQLGRIGHVRGLQSKLQEIETEHVDNKRFVTQLRGLVANFDLRRFMNTLEGMRKNG
jgi:CheY-like chemotaxis protein